MRNLGFDALLDKEVEEHFGAKPNKRYTGKVLISYVVEVDVEAENESAAKDEMTTEAFAILDLKKIAAESEIWDFTEIS